MLGFCEGLCSEKITRLWRDDVTLGLLLDCFSAIASKVFSFGRGDMLTLALAGDESEEEQLQDVDGLQTMQEKNGWTRDHQFLLEPLRTFPPHSDYRGQLEETD